MCGIAGIWGKVKEKELKDMIDSLFHRGPDAEGMYISEESGILGHRRLSIMDPGGGDQSAALRCRHAAHGDHYAAALAGDRSGAPQPGILGGAPPRTSADRRAARHGK